MSKYAPHSPPKQATISSFFAPGNPPRNDKGKKRATSPIDLTVDSPISQSPKRARTLDVPLASSPRPIDARAEKAAEQWNYVSPSKMAIEPSKSGNADDQDIRKKRHEAFKKKLLENNNTFIRKPSQEENNTETMDMDEENSEKSSGNNSDDAFRALTAHFERKSKGPNKTPPREKRNSSSKHKRVAEIGPSGQAYTPLELQVRQLKRDNPGTVIMVEVGYKYRFFGEDAKVAAKELGIACFTARNFLTASIPTHRLEVHLKKLLSQGHRVGIATQTETAALKKVGENRSAPFDRRLTHLYTAATYVDQLNSVDDLDRYSPPPLMCLIEMQRGGMGPDERVSIGVIVICPSTGDVIWDEFEDNHMRTELETRMVHTRPAELLLPANGLSKPTERILMHFSEGRTGSQKIRLERFNGILSYTDAFAFVSEFYTDKSKHAVASEMFQTGELMAVIVDLPQCVVVALAHAIKHLSDFNIADAFLETKFFNRFTSRAHMLLNGNTLTSLEIFHNETDYSTKGSLIWILDRTKTKFGARLLKSWIGRPLVDIAILQDRIDAVEEIISSRSEKLVSLREVLKNLPDLAKGLCRIQYGKCTPQELAILLQAFNKIGNAFEIFDSPSRVGLKSGILNNIIASFPRLKEPVKQLLGDILSNKAAQGEKEKLWTDPLKYPDIADLQMAIGAIEVELEDELKSIRKQLKRSSLQWKSVAGEEYLVEVKKSENQLIPDTWIRMSATKTMERFQSPTVKRKLQERAEYKETLAATAHQAFLSFLGDLVSNHYTVMRNAINNLAIADCLFSLAMVALQNGYVKPEFTEEDTLAIVGGRHPMIEALRADPFVPNTIYLGGGEARSKIITGPNMGGKSSAVRMIALIAIMAQIGSYVPAASARLGMLDSILTRMGASDEITRGRSTFMVEMSETSDILRSATRRSLVILDELGRGTSTADGMAVAYAVLHHLVENTKCKTLFITHYPLIAIELERKFPSDLQNLHMGYTAETRIDGTREITFLYQLIPGAATESFGIECARLAGVPDSVLEIATKRSAEMSDRVQRSGRKKRAEKNLRLLSQCLKRSGQPTES